jgi:hypothetical protein
MDKRRGRKKSKIGLILLCLTPMAAVSFFMWRSNQAQVGGTAFKQLPATEQTRRREHLIQLEEQVKDIGRKVKAKEKAPFELVITEEDLNTLLQDRVDTNKFPIREPRAGFTPGQLTLQGTANYKGISAPASLSGSLHVQGGQVVFKADSLSVQGFPVGSLKDKAENEINKTLREGLEQTSVKLESITIEQGQMTLRGQTQ